MLINTFFKFWTVLWKGLFTQQATFTGIQDFKFFLITHTAIGATETGT